MKNLTKHIVKKNKKTGARINVHPAVAENRLRFLLLLGVAVFLIPPLIEFLGMVCHKEEDVARFLYAFSLFFFFDCQTQCCEEVLKECDHIRTGKVVHVHGLDTSLDVFDHVPNLFGNTVVDRVVGNLPQDAAQALRKAGGQLRSGAVHGRLRRFEDRPAGM